MAPVKIKLLTVVAIFAASSCAHEISHNSGPVGWIDDETYIVEACGIDQDKESSPVESRRKARLNAINAARKIALEKLIGERINAGYDAGREYVVRELGQAIKGGEVVGELWARNGVCTIRYRIHARGLRKRLLRMSKG